MKWIFPYAKISLYIKLISEVFFILIYQKVDFKCMEAIILAYEGNLVHLFLFACKFYGKAYWNKILMLVH